MLLTGTDYLKNRLCDIFSYSYVGISIYKGTDVTVYIFVTELFSVCFSRGFPGVKNRNIMNFKFWWGQIIQSKNNLKKPA